MVCVCCSCLVLVLFGFVVDGCSWRLLRCDVWSLLCVVVLVCCCSLLLLGRVLFVVCRMLLFDV